MKIVSLQTFTDEVAGDVVSLAADVQQQVQKGDCVGIGVILVMRNGETHTKASKSTERHRMLAGMLDLLCDYQKGPTS